MEATITEIAPEIFRISVYPPGAPVSFGCFLIRDDQPTMVETGLQSMYGLVHDAVRRPYSGRPVSPRFISARGGGVASEGPEIAKLLAPGLGKLRAPARLGQRHGWFGRCCRIAIEWRSGSQGAFRAQPKTERRLDGEKERRQHDAKVCSARSGSIVPGHHIVCVCNERTNLAGRSWRWGDRGHGRTAP